MNGMQRSTTRHIGRLESLWHAFRCGFVSGEIMIDVVRFVNSNTGHSCRPSIGIETTLVAWRSSLTRSKAEQRRDGDNRGCLFSSCAPARPLIRLSRENHDK